MIETGQPVERIRRLAGGLAVETRSGARAFDRVVVTSAVPLAAKICQDLSEGDITIRRSRSRR